MLCCYANETYLKANIYRRVRLRGRSTTCCSSFPLFLALSFALPPSPAPGESTPLLAHIFFAPPLCTVRLRVSHFLHLKIGESFSIFSLVNLMEGYRNYLRKSICLTSTQR